MSMPTSPTDTTPPASTTLETANPPASVEVLSSSSIKPADVSTDDGWEVEEIGRVRGGGFDAIVQAEQEATRNADGSDPDVLGKPQKLPNADISDDDDGAPAAPNAERADTKPATKGRLAMSKRVEKLKDKIDENTRVRRELERGNLDVARRLLAESEGRQSDDRARRVPTSGREERPRGEDGRFTRQDAPRDPEPTVGARPTRPNWEQDYEAADKSWAEYNRDLAKYETALDAWHDQKAEHRAWQIRNEIGGEIAKRDRMMQDIAQATARERADAAFDARRSVVQKEYGEDRWKDVVENWREYDTKGYASDFLETVIQLHASGPRVMGALGEQIEKAAVLAEHQWTKGMFDGIMALEDPTAVLLALADDPEAFERIADLPPPRAIAALGALDGRLSVQARAHGSRPAPVSKAPTPARPVGGRRERAGGSDSSGSVFDDGVDFVSYVTRRNAGER